MTTIKDVARYAKVSITSASYALNNTGTISAATRKRVLEAAEKLNYHPNAFARNLVKKKTHTIGVFISRFGGSFYEEILEGIHDTVLKTDYELIICPETRRARKILTHRQVDGAIVFDSKIQTETITRLASPGFPIVVLDRMLEGDQLFPVLIDNRAGVHEAFYHLFNQGARSLGYVSGALDSFDNSERMEAFLGEAGKNGITVQVYYGNFTEESGHDAASMIIRNGHLPEAVFCANDQMAIGFIRAMKENGLDVPGDIGVVGFDDIDIAHYMQPTLTTVSASRFLWGSRAASQLIDYIENEAPFQAVRIPTKLIKRDSSRLKIKVPVS